MTIVHLAIQVFSIATVIGQILLVFFLLAWIFRAKKILQFFSKNAVFFMLLVSLGSVFGSLFFSEIAKFTPCQVCWFIRIFMYPQVVILAIALWRKDNGAFIYSMALSLIGVGLGIYQYLLQLGTVPSTICTIVANSPSCSDRYVNYFGYITIPMMAITAFLLILSLGVLGITKKEQILKNV